MRAYTFYNRFHELGDPTRIINLWQESWEKQGWDTAVLSEADAATHPRYDQFCQRVDSYPTVNGRNYEHACYVRWLAMAQMKDSMAVCSDYDVINRSFTSDYADGLPVGGGGVNLILLEPTRVPCAVLGTPRGFEMLCDELMNYQYVAGDQWRGNPHVSDMEIIRKSRIPYVKVCVEYGCSGQPIPNHPGEGWRKAPLIHFATFSFIRKGMDVLDKSKLIKEQLELLNNETRLEPVL